MAKLKEEREENLTIIHQIEKLLEKIDVKEHFPKLTNDKMKLFIHGFGKNILKDSSVDEMMKNLFIFSGSFIEGAPFARLVNPTLKRNYIEFEFDIMSPSGRVIDNKCDEVVYDLEHAKGFVWLKYNEEAIEIDLKNGRTINDYITKHDDGIEYLNSNAFKEEFSEDLFTKPDMSYVNKFTEEIQRPSNNIDMVMMFGKMAKQSKIQKRRFERGGEKC